jgi:hypothetical protein
MKGKQTIGELVIAKGKEVIKTFAINPDDFILTIGRHHSNDINLPEDPKVSRTHAAVVLCQSPGTTKASTEAEPVLVVRDLGSAKGTRVGGEFIRKKVLEDGDKIAIGDYRLTFRRGASGIDPADLLPLDRRFDHLPDLALSGEKTHIGAFAGQVHGGLSEEERELILGITRGNFDPDIAGCPEPFADALRSVLRAERCLVGTVQEDKISFCYQQGFEREKPTCSSQLVTELRTQGPKLQPGALWIPLTDTSFLAFFRTRSPAFTELDLRFADLACGFLIKSGKPIGKSGIALPWRVGVVGLADIKDQCRRIASDAGANSNVLITGETGTGKEVLARFIHDSSARRGKPFLTANCGALPRDLVYSELFGHAEGAFTGATEKKTGFFELARGGTLFLDEVGDLSLEAQVALLTALQQNEIRPLSHNGPPIKIDVRVIAATDRNLEQKVKSDDFRRAFTERFPHQLGIPPLRERLYEIPVLAYYFLDRYTTGTEGFSRDALELLRRYLCPGNVRELQNLIERVVLEEKEIIFSWDLPPHVRLASQINDYKRELNKSLKETEKERIIEALKETRGNVTKAAKLLGISRGTFYNKAKEYGLKVAADESIQE